LTAVIKLLMPLEALTTATTTATTSPAPRFSGWLTSTFTWSTIRSCASAGRPVVARVAIAMISSGSANSPNSRTPATRAGKIARKAW